MRAYTSPEALDSMRKVVLEVKGEPALRSLAAALEGACARLLLASLLACGAARPLAAHPNPASPKTNLPQNLHTAAGVAHKLWVEQPEGFATCLATKPAPKSTLALHLKKLPLCKTALGG